MSRDDGVPELIEELATHLVSPGPVAIRSEATRRRKARRVVRAGVLTSLLAIGVGAWAVNNGNGSTNDVASGSDIQSPLPVGVDSAPVEVDQVELTDLERLEQQGLWRALTSRNVRGVADVSFDDGVFALTNGCITRSFHIEPTAEGFTTRGFAGVELLNETYLGSACGLIDMTGPGLEVRRNQIVTISFDAATKTYTLTHADDDGWPWSMTLGERLVPAQQQLRAAVASLREDGGQLEFRGAVPVSPFEIAPHNTNRAFLQIVPGTNDDTPQLLLSNGCEAIGFEIVWSESSFTIGQEVELAPNSGRVDAARCRNPGEQQKLTTSIGPDQVIDIAIAGGSFWLSSSNGDWAILSGIGGAGTDLLQIREPQLLPVPNLDGLDLGLALDLLDQAGLLAGDLGGSGNARCLVGATDPPASTLVEPRTKVTVVLTECSSRDN